MFNPKSQLIKDNLPKIKEILMHSDVNIYVVPTPKLRELIFKNEHQIIKKLGIKTRNAFIDGNGLLVQKLMIWKWINDELDDDNKFILENSEIKVLGDNTNIIN